MKFAEVDCLYLKSAVTTSAFTHSPFKQFHVNAQVPETSLAQELNKNKTAAVLKQLTVSERQTVHL